MLFKRFKNKLAIIPLNGPIMGGGQSLFSPVSTQSSVEQVKSFLKEIKNRKRYRGLVLEINSPGGSPFLSKELGELVEGLDVYTVANVKEVCASGGYWVACSCDEIVGDELSTVGGVGTLSVRPDFSDFLDKLGVDFDVKSAGKFKEFGLPFSEPSREEEEQREKVLDKVNELFRKQVRESRDIDEDKDVLEGKVYLGEEAEELGLVDCLGDREKAIEVCERGCGYRDLAVVDFGEKMRKGPSLLDFIRG